ncbi:hypothetical protein F5884DRAFT_686956 [Xylogone sp. PMI_703]|nr:hypothetical protein F5884DRAFT_686956 [Xylogone sp. PMI_703]
MVQHESVAMFEAARERFPASWRADRWYLTVVAALVASGKPQIVGKLYSFLISQPEYSTTNRRKHLVRRIREALVRCSILNGVPIVMEATSSLAAVECEEDKDYSFLRESWQPGEVNTLRAMDTLDLFYQNDLPKILNKFDAHRDIRFMIVDIEYGLCLTENAVLDLVETEFVVLPAVMCQNLVGPTLWHLRCNMRAGVSKDDVELIHQTIEIVADFAGRQLHPIGRVDDVEEEMHNRMP